MRLCTQRTVASTLPHCGLPLRGVRGRELWFLRGVHCAGAARLLLPLSVVVGAWVNHRRFLRLSRSYTLGLIFCSKFEAEYCLCVNRDRSCLEVCIADVIRKFQILVWCLNKVRSSSVIEFHPHCVVSVTRLTLYCKFCQCSASEEVGA